jgi:predicted  nucleic acid-binding Zn-ribbon protein
MSDPIINALKSNPVTDGLTAVIREQEERIGYLEAYSEEQAALLKVAYEEAARQHADLEQQIAQLKDELREMTNRAVAAGRLVHDKEQQIQALKAALEEK